MKTDNITYILSKQIKMKKKKNKKMKINLYPIVVVYAIL